MTALTDTGVARAPRIAKVIRDDALGRLRHGWGEAYRIGYDPRRRWWAQRRDGEGEEITAPDEDCLWEAIRADYTTKPVPRDVPRQKAAVA